MTPGFKSGWVALIGAPNVGKSTLLNRILGQKLSIVSAKPQTTRLRLLGIKHLPEAQILFLDTPGIHQGKTGLSRILLKTTLQSLKEADLLLWMISVTEPESPDNDWILKILKKTKTPVILVLNKIDLVPRKNLLPLLDRFARVHPFRSLIPLSALKGEQVDQLLQEILQSLPEGPAYYPPDMVTDLSREQAWAEIVREKILWVTHQEIPHAAAVLIEEIKTVPDRPLMMISASILVERPSQKGILIGREGRMIKKIGELSRKELEILLKSQVHLSLRVKVEKDWRDNLGILSRMGYESREL
jgi:GTP-binding protein Era